MSGGEEEKTKGRFGKSIYRHSFGSAEHGENKDLKDNCERKSRALSKLKKQKGILSTLDILTSLFVVTPCVVACWRGTWQLLDVYSEYFPPWESFIIGLIIQMILNMTQENFHEILNRKHHNWFLHTLQFLATKFYTIMFNVIINIHWRGGWHLTEHYFGIAVTDEGVAVKDKYGAFVFFFGCYVLLILVKGLRNLNSPPFELCLDYGDDMFLFPNMLKAKGSEKMSLYLLDVFFTVVVINNLGVFIWQGFWLLVDINFFPDDFVFSSWAGLFLGYTMVAITFLSQSVMKTICDNLSGIQKLLVADAYLTFAVMGVILVWRGIWCLTNIYFLPENEELSCWLSHWIPMLILIVMGCSNSVLIRGGYVDCEEPDGTCVVFPCRYLRELFEEEKTDTWKSIWTGKNKTDNEPAENKTQNAINYHVINVNDILIDNGKNGNVKL